MRRFAQALRADIAPTPDFTVFPGTKSSGHSYHRMLYEQVLGPVDRAGSNQPTNPTSTRAARSALLILAMKLVGKLPHELTLDDILAAGRYEGSTIGNAISEAFAAYKADEFVWAHERVEAGGVYYPDLIAEYRRSHPPPWDVLREVMAEMRAAGVDDGPFDFAFSDPGTHSYDQFSVRAEDERATGAQYDLSSLSSGAKLLERTRTS